MIIILTLFWLCIFLVFHSYVIYPALLTFLVKGKAIKFIPNASQPEIVVFMSVYNAEQIIAEKIRSVFEGKYPKQKIRFLVGSDNSNDNTNTILKSLESEYAGLRVVYYTERQGKVKIINDLYSMAMKDVDKEHTLFISTDATALFDPECIPNLVKYFGDPEVAAVGANIIKKNMRKDGISGQEKAYYSRELEMKYEEGLIWGTAIGVFGACYAIRPDDFTPVPDHFLVDDFYITMCILIKGRKVMYDMDAKVYMNLANESGTEYRRKVRIAAGNFQNLSRFWKVLFGLSGLSFAFLSHKVLRWFGPFFIITSMVCCVLLIDYHWIYLPVFCFQLFLIIFPFINYLLESMNFHQRYLKFIAHFYLMNFGVLVGFFKYLSGIKSTIWEPTRR